MVHCCDTGDEEKNLNFAFQFQPLVARVQRIGKLSHLQRTQQKLQNGDEKVFQDMAGNFYGEHFSVVDLLQYFKISGLLQKVWQTDG